MPKIPSLTAEKVIKLLLQHGFELDHQTGSHMILYHKSRPTLSIPNHKELAPCLLMNNFAGFPARWLVLLPAVL